MEIVIAVMLILFLVFCTYMIIKTSKLKKAQKKRVKELKAQGLTNTVTALHINGLPIAEGVACNIMSFQDRFEFQSGTTHIKLDAGKISDVCIKTETDIQQQYVSSVGGAVGGAVLFGPLGAMIGGRAKKKTTRSISYFMIITYTNTDGDTAFIGFNVSGCFFVANKIVKEFHQTNPDAAAHIDL